MGKEGVDLVTVAKPQEKRSLLERFEIPVEHLSYEYVSKCTDGRELERIVTILRSGEEGIFPDLISHAEKRLGDIKPSSKILKVEEPVITRSMLDPEERRVIDEDMEKWMSEMQSREKDLEDGKSLISSIGSSVYLAEPEIRKMKKLGKNISEKKLSSDTTNGSKNLKTVSISSCDYERWDKFDADAELDRIDLTDERENAASKNFQRMENEKRDKARTMKFSKENFIKKSTLTATELSVIAEQERNIGNEAYRAGDYEEALVRYTSSIGINSTVNGYNNRAITNIKLNRYEEALNDCNVVISMEYDNVTALMRRGLALEKLERNSEAIVDYQSILKIEPNNKIAIAGLNRIRKPSGSKKVRMKIEEEKEKEEEEEEKGIVDKFDTKDEEKRSFKENFHPNQLKVLEKKICFCDRAPSFSQYSKPPPHLKSSYCLSESEYSFNLTRSRSKASIVVNNSDSSKNKSSKVLIEELKIEKDYLSKIEENNLAKGDCNEKIFINDRLINKSENKISNNKNNKIEIESKYERATIRTDRNENKKNRDLDSVDSPYEFLHFWQSLKNDNDFFRRGKLLRSLSPEDLDFVIGNKLDGEMLSAMIRCIDKHFADPTDANLARRYLIAFTKLRRFSIVNLFLDSEDKKVLSRIIKRIANNKTCEDGLVSAELCRYYGVSD